MNDIFTIATNLATQDSRMTSNPVFVVQQKVRQFPGDPDADDPYYWVDGDWNEVDDETGKLLHEAEEEGRYDFYHPDDEIECGKSPSRSTHDYSKVYYRDVYRFVQPFLTEAGAKCYIEINGHNLREPRIYVESGWRNEEWETIREVIMGMGKLREVMKDMGSVQTPPDIQKAIEDNLIKLL